MFDERVVAGWVRAYVEKGSVGVFFFLVSEAVVRLGGQAECLPYTGMCQAEWQNKKYVDG